MNKGTASANSCGATLASGPESLTSVWSVASAEAEHVAALHPCQVTREEGRALAASPPGPFGD